MRTNTNRRLARDTDITDEVMEQCLTFLTNRLSREDMARFKSIILSSQGDEDPKDADNTGAQDSPASFKGVPRTGGGMASDSLDSYARNFPDAMRIKQVW